MLGAHFSIALRKRLTKPSIWTCSLLTDSVAMHCFEGIDTEDGVVKDLLQVPLKDS